MERRPWQGDPWVVADRAPIGRTTEPAVAGPGWGGGERSGARELETLPGLSMNMPLEVG